MASSENLDALRVGAVTSEEAMVVPIGAHQISQHLGVTGIGFRARDIMAVAIASHRQRVDRIELIARRHQGLHPQATIGFDADHDLGRRLRVISDQLMQRADTGQSLRQTSPCDHRPRLVHQMHIVMILCPVVSDEQHRGLSLR